MLSKKLLYSGRQAFALIERTFKIMSGIEINRVALLFIFKLRYPPGVSIARVCIYDTYPTDIPDATMLVHNDLSFGAILFPIKL